MRASSLLLSALPLSLCFGLVGACEDATSPTTSAPDASTPTLEGGAPTDGPVSSPDTGSPDSSTTDAGKDAPATNNSSAWTPAAGLPESACTPWTLVDTADPENPELAGGKLTISTSADAENVYYVQKDVITPPELVIEVRVRLVSGAQSAPTRGPAFIGYHYGPEKRKTLFFLADGEAFLLAAENTKGASAAVATTDAMHTYKIVTNTSTHAIEVFRDNVSILTGVAFQEAQDPNATPDIVWGEGSSFANGVSEWELVKHNAHTPTTCP